MDLTIATTLVRAAAAQFRFLEGARVLHEGRLGKGRIGILVDDLTSGRVEYTYALVVYDTDASLVCIVTAEVNELATGAHDSHFLGCFEEEGRANLGLGPWGDAKAFYERAREVALAHSPRAR